MAKKLHWTQTPEGRKRMSKITKASRRKRRLVTKTKEVNHVEELPDEAQEALNTAFVLGKVDYVIEQYAASIGVPKAPLARRVAELLLGATSG